MPALHGPSPRYQGKAGAKAGAHLSMNSGLCLTAGSPDFIKAGCQTDSLLVNTIHPSWLSELQATENAARHNSSGEFTNLQDVGRPRCAHAIRV